jgi:hypothetical protein
VELLNTLLKLTVALGAGQMYAASCVGVGLQNRGSGRITIASGIAVTREEKKTMIRRPYLCALVLTISYLGIANAQQYPIMDRVADKVIQKYQQSTCEQLWEKKSAKTPPTAEEQRAIAFLKSDPQMRTAFINKVAAPIANKMFECGLIP